MKKSYKNPNWQIFGDLQMCIYKDISTTMALFKFEKNRNHVKFPTLQD